MRKDRKISSKGSRRKCEKPHFTEPGPSPPTIPGSAVPLTKEALRLLNRNTRENSKNSNSNMSEVGTTDAQRSINAYDPEYRNALEDGDIHFAEKTDTPPDFDELRQAMLLPGSSPEPNDIVARNLRARLTNANNENASLRESDMATRSRRCVDSEYTDRFRTDLKPHFSAADGR